MPPAENADVGIRAILFDFDGVLVDSEYLHYQCWLEALRPYGAAIGWQRYQRQLTGIGDPEAAPILLSLADENPSDEAVARALETKNRLYRTRCRDELAVSTEVCFWITDASSRLLLGVVSSSSREEVEPLLTAAGIRPALRVLVCAEDVSRRKPDPEPYLVALDRLRRIDPSVRPGHCLVYEDSDPGATAALAAGMAVQRVTAPAELANLLASAH